MFQAADGRSAEGTKDIRLIPGNCHLTLLLIFHWQNPSPVVTTFDPKGVLEMCSKKKSRIVILW